MTADTRQLFVDSMMSGSETVYELIHPDCVISHPPVLPYGGIKIGPEGFRGIVDTLLANFDLEVEKTQTLLVDDIVLQRFWVTFIHKKTGRRARMTTAEIYRFEDGLVVEQDNFYKSPEIIAEMMAEVD